MRQRVEGSRSTGRRLALYATVAACLAVGVVLARINRPSPPPVPTLRWDLSSGNEASRVGWPAENSGDMWAIESAVHDARIVLPGNVAIHETASLIVVDREGERITRIVIHGMPLGERALLADLHAAVNVLGLTSGSMQRSGKTLEEWLAERLEDGGPIGAVGFGRRLPGTHVHVAVRDSFDRRRPRFLSYDIDLSGR